LTVEEPGEVFAAEQLHHHERLARFERTDVVDADDVVAREGGRSLTFAQEPSACLGLPSRLEPAQPEELDGDLLPELQVPSGDDHSHDVAGLRRNRAEIAYLPPS
jgi:hypothetical protein